MMKQCSTTLLSAIKTALAKAVDSTPESIAVFFKTGEGAYAEQDRFRGIRVPSLRKIAKQFPSTPFIVLKNLLQSPFNEERLLALIILSQQYRTASPEQKVKIYDFYNTHIVYVNNWNLVDSSAHLIIGAHLFQKECSILLEWAQSENMWQRRIAIVATWYFIRKGEVEWTFRIATALKNDTHDLIHKAVGWMLREAGKQAPSALIQFLDKHASTLPRTLLRYAIERLPTDQRKTYLRAKSLTLKPKTDP